MRKLAKEAFYAFILFLEVYLMAKILVAYFSESSTTKQVAEMLSDVELSPRHHSAPHLPYTRADLDWMNKKSRSSVEMNDKKIRPEIAEENLDMSAYDEILLGFPIWWYVAPTIINTFLEKYDLTGKKIILFATSGGSGFGNTVQELQPSAPGAEIVEGKLLNRAGKQEIEDWVKTL